MEGLSKCTAHTLLLIHKALSKREPDKQHYYHHQSPHTEETEAAKGERAEELAHSGEEEGGGGGGASSLGRSPSLPHPLGGEEVNGCPASENRLADHAPCLLPFSFRVSKSNTF